MKNPQCHTELIRKLILQDDLSKAFSIMIDDNEEFWYKLIKSNRITEEFIKSLAPMERCQIERIRKAFEKCITIEKIKLFAKPEFNCFQMDAIIDACSAEICFEKIEILANPSLPDTDMEEMTKAYRFGLSLEDAPAFASLPLYDKKKCAHELEKKEKIKNFYKLLKKD